MSTIITTTTAPLGLRLINVSLLGDSAMDETTERAVSVADTILEGIAQRGGADRDHILGLIKDSPEVSPRDHTTTMLARDADDPLAGLDHREAMLIEEAFQAGVATAWRLLSAANGGAR